MSVKKNLLESEPVVITGVVVGAVGAAVTLAVEFGVNLTQGQTTAIQGFVVAVLAVIYLLFVRSKVTPSVNVAVKDDGTGPRAADASELSNGTPVVIDKDQNVDQLGLGY